MKEEAKRYLEKAQRALRVSTELLKKEYFEDSCSKSYYVMFYAVVLAMFFSVPGWLCVLIGQQKILRALQQEKE